MACDNCPVFVPLTPPTPAQQTLLDAARDRWRDACQNCLGDVTCEAQVCSNYNQRCQGIMDGSITS